MSRHHSTQSNRVQDLVKQVEDTPQEYWEREFDIIVDEDRAGDIYDLLDEKHFVSLVEWAEYQLQMEKQDDDDRNYGYRFDDE